MLRNVLGAYLDSLKERELDLPFTTLLPAAGFHDVHFTHGQAEFGKDFIAKKTENGITLQYSFQLKAGDITQADFRTNVMGQMLESLLLTLSHPSFDKDLPHQAMLVTTGKLTGNAALELQALNDQIQNTYGKRPIIIWDKENLISLIDAHGLGAVYQATASGFISYGNFYQLYGKSMQCHASERDFEEHSRQWVDKSIESSKRLLCSAIEAQIFAGHCLKKGLIYEAIQAHLTLIRTIMYEIHTSSGTQCVYLIQLYNQAVARLQELCQQYITDVESLWTAADKNLVSITGGTCNMMTYLIHCARILEISGCLYFIEKESEAKGKVISFIESFISREPGCAHIPTDRYAISIVLPILALCSAERRESALQLIRNSTIWLCDRYQEGLGIANIAANAYEEISTLLGYAFDFIKVRKSKGSFAATVISDLSAFLGEKDLYADVVNDIKAANIVPQYWQIPDTSSLFSIEGEDIIAYPRSEYVDDLVPFDTFAFAEHIKHEIPSFSITEHTGSIGLMFMTLLMRDRYFPTLWPSLVK